MAYSSCPGRKVWKPDAQAWDQLFQLQRLVDQRVRIQFWNPVMYLLNEGDWLTRLKRGVSAW